MGSSRARRDPLYAVFAQLREALAPLGIHVDPALLPLWRDLARHGAEPFAAGGRFSPDTARRLVEVAEAIRRSSAGEPGGERAVGVRERSGQREDIE